MPTARFNLAAGAVNGKLYAIGGTIGGNQIDLGTNEAYDPTTDTWATKAAMPLPRQLGGTNAAVANGIIYVVGGTPPGSCTNEADAYNPATDTWTGLASMPTQRCAPTVVALNGLIYAIGGTNTNGSIKYSTMEIYDPITNLWSTGPSMLTGRQSAGGAAINGKIYVVGGFAGPGGYLSNNEVYDPVANSWTAAAPMPTMRGSFGTGVINGVLFAVGGNNSSGILSTVEAYNPVTNAWTTQSALPTARAYLGSDVINGVLYAVGGLNSSGSPVATNEAFTLLGPKCTPPPSGLVGWWPGDGNARDITDNDHDGTLHGATFASGEVGQAFSFDGTDDFVDVPNASALNIPSGKITVDAWIYPTAAGQFYPSILGKGNVGNFQESYALFLDPGGAVDFLVNTDGTSAGRGIVFGATPIPLNMWTLVAGTYDGTTVKVYVNGILDGMAPHAGTAINGTPNDLLIGKADRSTPNSSPYPDSYFTGRIDEAELFNQALSTTDIGNIYKAGTAGKCKCQEKPVEAEGDVKDEDGHNSKMRMRAQRDCDDSGKTHFEDDSGKVMDGSVNAITISGNTAIVSGPGNLLDGTPVHYTAVLLGNQPVIGANLFSISWTTATGSVFQRSGALMDGYIVVPPQ